MAVQLGSVIWTAIRSILKFVFTAACGTLLARAKLLDSTGTRTISQCILNIFLPALVFTKIVQGIDQGKMKQVGVIALTSVMYTVLGLLFGVLVRTFTRVPKGWRYGVLAAGAFSNWGDLPLLLIGTIVTAPPFDATADEAKGLAYVSVYIFMQTTIMFALNGIWLVKKDFETELADIRDVSTASVKARHVLETLRDGARRRILPRRFRPAASASTPVVAEEDLQSSRPTVPRIVSTETPSSGLAKSLATIEFTRKTTRSGSAASRTLRSGEALGLARTTSQESLTLKPVTSGVLNPGDMQSTIEMSDISRVPSRLPRYNSDVTIEKQQQHSSTRPPISRASSRVIQEEEEDDDEENHNTSDRLARKKKINLPRIKSQAGIILQRFLSPPSISVIVSFIIAVIPQVKALFVVVPGVDMPSAPDGKPPLDFIIDTTSFIGGASVPSSLLILGYSLSRLKVSKLPALRSALLMGLLKMVVLPIIAIAWMQFLATSSANIIDASDLVLRLVLVLPAAVPTATSLLYITSIFAPEDREENVECLGVFLIIQYLMVGVTLTITVVYTLNSIT